MQDALGLNPFRHLQRNADVNPNGVFLHGPGQRLTNEHARVFVKQIAYELRRIGVQPGDVVALDLPETLSILFTEALFHEAATSTILPAGYRADGVFSIDWIISNGSPAPQGTAQIVVIDAQFLRNIEQNPYGIEPRDGVAEVTRILFSSGTTGVPHAIGFGLETELFAELAVESWLEGDPFVVLFDTSTAGGYAAFYLSVKLGRPYIAAGGANPAEIVDLIVANDPTSLKGSPAQIAAILEELEQRQLSVSSVQSVYVGGTVMPPGLAEQIQLVTGGCRTIALYGSTEAMMTSIRDYPSDNPFDVGHILPGVTVEIVDEDDRPLPVGSVGQLRVKDPAMVHSYIGDDEATVRSFHDGWFYSGDLALIRSDGGLTLAGRISELLNAGGVKVDPNQIDRSAQAFAEVSDAASFGYATRTGLQRIGLAVVASHAVDAAALAEHLKAEFGPAAPELIAKVDSIPRNAMGKPKRLTLADQFRER